MRKDKSNKDLEITGNLGYVQMYMYSSDSL